MEKSTAVHAADSSFSARTRNPASCPETGTGSEMSSWHHLLCEGCRVTCICCRFVGEEAPRRSQGSAPSAETKTPWRMLKREAISNFEGRVSTSTGAASITARQNCRRTAQAARETVAASESAPPTDTNRCKRPRCATFTTAPSSPKRAARPQASRTTRAVRRRWSACSNECSIACAAFPTTRPSAACSPNRADVSRASWSAPAPGNAPRSAPCPRSWCRTLGSGETAKKRREASWSDEASFSNASRPATRHAVRSACSNVRATTSRASDLGCTSIASPKNETRLAPRKGYWRAASRSDPPRGPARLRHRETNRAQIHALRRTGPHFDSSALPPSAGTAAPAADTCQTAAPPRNESAGDASV
mmetsp:Transcript_5246/g.18619  ORF Transcript_5246/g.18619 Transcript_5246/m.18619 type:complete len:362 (+) Transcript_5246:2399-3484(+)